MKDWNKWFLWIFLSTGVFATVGALFTWGEGWLFVQPHQCITVLPWADLMVASPLSFITAYGFWRKRKWRIVAGAMTCGVYLYGSVLVYIQVIWHHAPYVLQLLIPPVFGLSIVVGYLVWVIKNPDGMDRVIPNYSHREEVL